jgi:predicted RNA binding protein YcfA (HicA-like mRNA interferase family)
VDFPSLKAKALLALLRRPPLSYEISRQKGSHRVLDADGYPRLGFSFHDGVSVPPGVVKKILVKDVGLSEEQALKVAQGKAEKGEV